jgi:hypothetical protein
MNGMQLHVPAFQLQLFRFVNCTSSRSYSKTSWPIFQIWYRGPQTCINLLSCSSGQMSWLEICTSSSGGCYHPELDWECAYGIPRDAITRNLIENVHMEFRGMLSPGIWLGMCISNSEGCYHPEFNWECAYGIPRDAITRNFIGNVHIEFRVMLSPGIWLGMCIWNSEGCYHPEFDWECPYQTPMYAITRNLIGEVHIKFRGMLSPGI